MAQKIITIEDFSGGRTNWRDQTLIPQNTHASGQNVWAIAGSLVDPPIFTPPTNPISGASIPTLSHVIYDDTVNSNFNLYYRVVTGATGTNTAQPWASSNLTTQLTALGYTTGTVTLNPNAPRISATGVGTSWAIHVSANDRFQFTTATGTWYGVASIEDATHLTLDNGTPGATGQAYLIQTGISSANSFEIAAASLNGSMLWSTTGDNMQRYDSTGMTRLTAGPQAAYLTVFKGYLFAARSNTFTSRIFWSAIKDPTSWPANNFIDIDKANGVITGLFAYGAELIVFKNRAMYKVIGDVFDPSNPTYQVIRISTAPDFLFSSNYSCAIHNGTSSVAAYAVGSSSGTIGFLVFHSRGRTYRYRSGTLFIEDVSKEIINDATLWNYGSLTDAHGNTDQQIVGAEYRDMYFLKGFPSGSGTKEYCFMLDSNWKWWMFYNPGSVLAAGVFARGNIVILPNATVPFTFSNPQYMYPWNVLQPSSGGFNTYNGSSLANPAAASNWVSKEFNIEYGIFKRLVVYFKKVSGTAAVSWSIDQATAVSSTIDLSVGRGNVIRAVLPINQKGSTIQITLSRNLSANFRVYGLKIYYELSDLERLL